MPRSGGAGAEGREATMGRDSKAPARSEPTLPPGAPRARLSAPAGQPSARVETSQPVTLIGSRRDCDLSINHADVSKLHCALVNTGSAIIVADLCSRAGTFINGRRVSVASVAPGNELRVGPVAVDVEFIDAPASAAVTSAGQDDPNTSLSTPLRLTGSEERVELSVLPAVIGRRKACQVVLDTPDVSLAHALLLTIAGCPAVFDLGSRSGTYLNDERVTLAWLRGGDRLCIGGEELALAWDGPEYTAHEPATSHADEVAAIPETPENPAGLNLPGLSDLESIIRGLKGQISASQAKLQERTAMLENREAELETQVAALEQQRTQLASERQVFGKQTAELRAAAAALEQDRAGFEASRAQYEEERARVEALHSELEQQLAAHEATIARLSERESALDERQAAIAAAEQDLAGRQAELARSESANADAARRIEQFKKALNEARSAFAAVDAAGGAPPTPGLSPPAAPAKRAPQAGDSTRPAPAKPAANDGLPAPMVDKPLFSGLASQSIE